MSSLRRIPGLNPLVKHAKHYASHVLKPSKTQQLTKTTNINMELFPLAVLLGSAICGAVSFSVHKANESLKNRNVSMSPEF